jgi:zinc protease
MKKSWVIVILALACGLPAAAQTQSKSPEKPTAPPAPVAMPSADQILARYVKAIGGQDAWKKLSSRLSVGTIEVPAMNLSGTVEMHEKAPNKMLATITVAGATYRQGFDGTVGWSDDPRDGLRQQTGIELEETKRDSDFYHPLDLHKLYSKFTVTGTEKIEERTAYVVEATPPQGEADKLYFDADSGLVVRIISRHHLPEGVVVFQEEISNYREIDGIKLPFTVRQSSAESEFVLQFTEVKHNVEFEDAQFAKPAAQQ